MPDRMLMICVDVNLLIHAADAVTTGFVRIVANGRIMPSPLRPNHISGPRTFTRPTRLRHPWCMDCSECHVNPRNLRSRISTVPRAEGH